VVRVIVAVIVHVLLAVVVHVELLPMSLWLGFLMFLSSCSFSFCSAGSFTFCSTGSCSLCSAGLFAFCSAGSCSFCSAGSCSLCSAACQVYRMFSRLMIVFVFPVFSSMVMFVNLVFIAFSRLVLMLVMLVLVFVFIVFSRLVLVFEFRLVFLLFKTTFTNILICFIFYLPFACHIRVPSRSSSFCSAGSCSICSAGSCSFCSAGLFSFRSASSLARLPSAQQARLPSALQARLLPARQARLPSALHARLPSARQAPSFTFCPAGSLVYLLLGRLARLPSAQPFRVPSAQQARLPSARQARLPSAQLQVRDYSPEQVRVRVPSAPFLLILPGPLVDSVPDFELFLTGKKSRMPLILYLRIDKNLKPEALSKVYRPFRAPIYRLLKEIESSKTSISIFIAFFLFYILKHIYILYLYFERFFKLYIFVLCDLGFIVHCVSIFISSLFDPRFTSICNYWSNEGYTFFIQLVIFPLRLAFRITCHVAYTVNLAKMVLIFPPMFWSPLVPMSSW
ncbi:hypothetical protein L9F63_021179, partial [Diploptera punctata]